MGCESFSSDTGTHETDAMKLVNHMRKIRSMEWTKKVLFIPIIEGNYCKTTAETYAQIFDKITSIQPLACLKSRLKKDAQTDRLRNYIHLTHGHKQLMANTLNTYLVLDYAYWLDDFICVNSPEPAEVRDSLYMQFERYSKVTKPRSDTGWGDNHPVREFKVEYTGKLGGQPDDMVVALQFGVLFARLFYAHRNRVMYSRAEADDTNEYVCI